MNVSIHLSAETEAVLLRRAEAAGKDVETFVKELISERLLEDVPPPAASASHEEFMDGLHRIIDMHPAPNGFVDDRRESIYAGQGE